MLSKMVLVRFLVGALVVQEAEAWFTRRLGHALLGAAAIAAIGKRGGEGADGVEGADGAPISPQEMAALKQQLLRDCPILYDPQGIKHDHVQAAFTESDVDGDGVLTGEEMSAFARVMKAIGVCKDLYEDSLSATAETSQTDVQP